MINKYDCKEFKNGQILTLFRYKNKLYAWSHKMDLRKKDLRKEFSIIPLVLLDKIKTIRNTKL